MFNSGLGTGFLARAKSTQSCAVHNYATIETTLQEINATILLVAKSMTASAHGLSKGLFEVLKMRSLLKMNDMH
jgi:hypothetical protein